MYRVFMVRAGRVMSEVSTHALELSAATAMAAGVMDTMIERRSSAANGVPVVMPDGHSVPPITPAAAVERFRKDTPAEMRGHLVGV